MTPEETTALLKLWERVPELRPDGVWTDNRGRFVGVGTSDRHTAALSRDAIDAQWGIPAHILNGLPKNVTATEVRMLAEAYGFKRAKPKDDPIRAALAVVEGDTDA